VLRDASAKNIPTNRDSARQRIVSLARKMTNNLNLTTLTCNWKWAILKSVILLTDDFSLSIFVQ